jgi:regulator of nucleoside diphosphate kinase
MNSNDRAPVVIPEEDFRLLKHFADQISSLNGDRTMTLSYELNRATVVGEDEFPADCVRLNSLVKIKELGSKQIMEFRIVMPAQADINQRLISVVTPMGAALIGLCKGEKVSWKMPAGMKSFEILDVVQNIA